MNDGCVGACELVRMESDVDDVGDDGRKPYVCDNTDDEMKALPRKRQREEEPTNDQSSSGNDEKKGTTIKEVSNGDSSDQPLT